MRRITIYRFLAAALLILASAGVRAEDEAQVEEEFTRFAGRWMLDLSASAARARTRAVLFATPEDESAEKISYRAATQDYATRTQATGKKAAPYVGFLTYTEETWECAGASEDSCKLIDSSPVTEIFPYKEGRWHY